MKEIATALVKAKRLFGPVLKDKTNPAFKSKYADLGACLEAVDAACLASGIAVYQETTEDTTGVTVETVFLHESGEALRAGKLHVPAVKHDPQGFGSALTYARRYSLMTACGIAPEDDDGNAAREAAEKAAAARRAQWLVDRKAEIAAAKNVGELKAVMDDALAIVREKGDQDAEEQLLAASAIKVAQAKPKTEGATQ